MALDNAPAGGRDDGLGLQRSETGLWDMREIIPRHCQRNTFLEVQSSAEGSAGGGDHTEATAGAGRPMSQSCSSQVDAQVRGLQEGHKTHCTPETIAGFYGVTFNPSPVWRACPGDGGECPGPCWKFWKNVYDVRTRGCPRIGDTHECGFCHDRRHWIAKEFLQKKQKENRDKKKRRRAEEAAAQDVGEAAGPPGGQEQ